jgi:hypothetical protein
MLLSSSHECVKCLGTGKVFADPEMEVIEYRDPEQPENGTS